MEGHMSLSEILHQISRQAAKAALIAENGGDVDAYFRREAEAAAAKLNAAERLIDAVPQLNGNAPKRIGRK
jgi:hypothetical protein